MSVQARMFVKSVTQNSHDPEGRQIVMGAITRGDEAKEWSRYTPSAELTMYITHPPAVAQFEVGREYLLTFEPVSKDVNG